MTGTDYEQATRERLVKLEVDYKEDIRLIRTDISELKVLVLNHLTHVFQPFTVAIIGGLAFIIGILVSILIPLIVKLIR